MDFIKAKNIDAGFAKCWIANPEISWPKRHGKNKISYRNPPKGHLISILFSNWMKGELNRDTKEILEEILTRPSDEAFWKICDKLGCDECPRREICGQMTNPLFERMILYSNAWESQKKTRRRALLLLAIFYTEGARPGGYFQLDIRRMAGVKATEGHNIVRALRDMGFLRIQQRKYKNAKRQPRYYYSPFGCTRSLEKFQHEFYKSYARSLKNQAGVEIQSLRHPTTSNDESSFVPLSCGIMFGQRPPDWLINTITEHEQLLLTILEGFHKSWLRSSMSDSQSAQARNQERVNEFLEPLKKWILSKDPVIQEIGLILLRMAKASKNLTKSDMNELKSFCEKVGVGGERHTLILYDISGMFSSETRIEKFEQKNGLFQKYAPSVI